MPGHGTGGGPVESVDVVIGLVASPGPCPPGTAATKALTVLLDAERLAPEQVRYHFLSRQLVLGWIRTQKGKPPLALADLARRLHVA